MIIGKNPVLEYLRSGKPVNKILISNTLVIDALVKEVLRIAKEKRITVKFVPQKILDEQFKGRTHQGIAALITGFNYAKLKDVIRSDAFLIALEHVQDPHNLGAVIRTAESLGAHAVIITKRESAEVTDTVFKASAGAASYLPIVKVTNLNNAFALMRRYNISIVGLEVNAKLEIGDAKLKGPVCFVLGSESEGLRHSTIQACDYTVRIPMKGRISSLNVSVSAAIAMYEKIRQENK